MAGGGRPWLHLGAYALCVNPADELLLARMCVGPSAGSWTLPGGGVEPGEHPDEAVVRELREETGLVHAGARPVVGVFSVVYEHSVRRPDGPVHHVGVVYDFRGVDGDVTDERGGSTDRCGWFGRDEVARLPLVPLGEYALRLAWPSPSPSP